MREQLLIALMFLLVIVLAGIWGIQQLNRQEKSLLLQLDNQELQIKQIRLLSGEWDQPVSYTHLTLPTILLV